MTPVDPSPAARMLAALLEARTGQRIGAGRLYRVDAALTPLMKARGLGTLEQLAASIASPGEAMLADQVVEALLNGETSFFRDPGVHELGVDLIEAARGGAPCGRPRVWSVGCSTGQEPLSLAMLLAERRPAGLCLPDIVATDVSAAAIARARAGVFTQFEIQRGLSVRRMVRWFDTTAAGWVARPELLARIAFRRHHLVGDVPPGGRFDVILCRNVLLYFSPERRRQAFDRLAAALRPGGTLLLGAGETVIGQTDAFVPSPRYRGAHVPAPPQRLAQHRARC